jgi:hypothetical protein
MGLKILYVDTIYYTYKGIPAVVRTILDPQGYLKTPTIENMVECLENRTAETIADIKKFHGDNLLSIEVL